MQLIFNKMSLLKDLSPHVVFFHLEMPNQTAFREEDVSILLDEKHAIADFVWCNKMMKRGAVNQ